MELTFNAKNIKRTLIVVLTTLIVLHILGELFLSVYTGGEVLSKLVRQFDLNEKENFPTLFGSLMLLLSAALLLIIGFAKRSAKDTYPYQWIILGISFLFLAVDESMTLHKTLFSVIDDQFGSVALLILAFVFVIAFAYFYWRFLFDLPPNTRWRFILAGVLYVGAAFGLQQLDEYYKATIGRNAGYWALTTLEESIELIGIVLFIGALLDYIAKEMPDLSLKIKA